VWLLRWAIAVVLLLAAGGAAASPDGEACGGPEAAACAPELDGGLDAQPALVQSAAPRQAGERARLVVYWGEGCPRCEEARPFVTALAASERGLVVEWIEVRRDPAGRARFRAEVERLRVDGAGVPMFVVGNDVVVGFRVGVTERAVTDAARAALAGAPRARGPDRAVDLPVLGPVDPGNVPFPLFTVLVGLADGVNPCAFYVLVAMLGILAHVRSRRRVALYGGVFVLMSGVVYFLFMTAWLELFALAGLATWITTLLGVVLVGMGLVNLKEVVWFKKGVSLMVPDRAKPGLFRRMRAIAGAASLPAALAGIAALAFVVNLVELGCTLGLPAVYTRLLSLRAGTSGATRLAYLALYNVAYVVPLALIVGAYAVSLRRLALTERRAKALKGLSGALLVVFGALFIAAPDTLR
jgi:hypothetical protein